MQGTLDRVRREQKAPGAAAAVVIGGCLWVGASGVADVRTREPVRGQTMFEVGSVTKTFVAALVLKLAEDGVLGLDDRLSRWVPAFPAGRRITLRQLLNHTAGTDNFVGDGRFLAAQRRRGLAATWTPQQLLRYRRGYSPSFLADSVTDVSWIRGDRAPRTVLYRHIYSRGTPGRIRAVSTAER